MTKKSKTAIGLMSLLMATSMAGTSVVASADVLKYNGKYYSDYTTHEEIVAAAEELNVEIASEGMVLLKNKDNMLPFGKDVRNVSVFGVRSDNLLLAGTGTGSVNAKTAPSLQYALESAGFRMNPTLLNLYAKDSTTTPKDEISSFGRSVTDSYKSYDDAAIVILSRVGGENADVSTDIGEAADEGEHIDGIQNKHYLELTNAEQALLEHVAQNFEKVVLVLNASNPMELKEIDQDKYGVDAAIWMSQPGQNGILALGKILNGEVNPSGKLVDFFERDFTSSPVWNNYGTGAQAVNNDGTPVYDKENNPYPNVYRDADGNIYGTVPNGNTPGTGFTEVQYEEGIYLGYKFYETMAYEMNRKEAGTGDAWYAAQTMFPFGYGLSYTSFEQNILGVYSDAACTREIGNKLAGTEETVYVKVNVKNTGSAAGKDVVQIYVNAPYTKGEIEKSYVQLVGMGKSDLIAPDGEDVVVVKVNVQDMASFDYNDANKNTYSTYELDEGQYNVFAMKNSHEKYDAYSFDVEADIILDADDFSGNEVEPLFSGEDEYNLLDYDSEGNLQMTLVSRADFIDGTYHQPEAATKEELTRDDAWFNRAVQRDYYAVADDGATDGGYTTTPWADETIPENWTQGTGVKDKDGLYAKQLSDMNGVAFDDPAWDEFMNQLTWEELIAATSFGSHGTAAIPTVGKNQTRETDGPIALSSGFAWCVEPLQAATWNAKLLERLGVLTANQAMLRWQDSSYTNANDLVGWYGPAMNTHRSHFLGRTFEYYSEDGILGGYMASAVVGGAESKGLNCWIKHFVLNDQEIYRKGINTYCTEQTFREIYCKPFQMAMQEGNATAIMTSFNRIGNVAAAVNYNLITRLAREEWGFDGVIVTDMYNSNCWPSTMLLRAGNDLPLGTVTPEGVWNADLRNGKGSVEVTSVSNFSCEKNYAAGDYVSTGAYVSRKLVQHFYKVKKAITAGEYTQNDLAAATDAFEEVKLEDIAGQIKAQSDIQYYYVRLCAKRMLYTEANTMNGKNGYDLSAFADKTLATVTQGSAVNESVAVDMGSEISSYEIVEGRLPEGLTLNANGTLSGTPVGTAGTYTFTVRAVYDNWVRTTAAITVTVNPAFSYNANGAAECGKAYAGAVDTEVFADEAKSYSLEGELPAGLTFDEATGEIVGTPAENGTYSVTIVVSVTANKTTNRYNVPVTIEVGGTPAAVASEIDELKAQLSALESKVATAEELAALKAQVTALEEGNDGVSAEEIAGIKARIEALEAESEKTASGGCGSAVGTGVGVTALGVLAIVAAVVVVGKRRGEDGDK